MQTLYINPNQNDFNNIFQKYLNEPVILQNNTGSQYLVLPFSKDNWQEIFLMLYKSFSEIQKTELEMKPDAEPKLTSKEFGNKWGGIISENDVANWKDDYLNHLNQKHK